MLLMLVTVLILSGACGPSSSEEERHREANTPAGKVGQAAHKAAVEIGKAGREINQKLEKAAHEAHEGWKEDAHKNQSK